ncbi:DUF6624 domain-containing protein [Glaciecola sp. 2405UD65-10]|uniref:DUF6624 domain-containing protein n=1 Tax=Glaciecola sp. 2405UD65-10 TaxID=3397244 RepID=UPI003B5C1844
MSLSFQKKAVKRISKLSLAFCMFANAGAAFSIVQETTEEQDDQVQEMLPKPKAAADIKNKEPENENPTPASTEKVPLDKETIKEIKTRLEEVLKDDQLHRNEIHKIKKALSKSADAEATQEDINYLWHLQEILDNKNQAIISTILDKHGWPKGTEYRGSKAGQTIFLVIQHAPIEFQERYFPMMQKATERGDIPPGAFAQLHDNILVSKGVKQRYGTQIKVNPKTQKPYIYPIEDEKNVDIRRAAVGLDPIAEYAKLFGVEYESPFSEIEDETLQEAGLEAANEQLKPL